MYIITNILALDTSSRGYRNLLDLWTEMMRCLMNICILWRLLKHSGLLTSFDLICILLTSIVQKYIWLLLDIWSWIVISIADSWLLSAKMWALMMSLLLLNELLLLNGCRNNTSTAADGWIRWWRSIYLVSIILSNQLMVSRLWDRVAHLTSIVCLQSLHLLHCVTAIAYLVFTDQF
jgi:hypothetical protein